MNICCPWSAAAPIDKNATVETIVYFAKRKDVENVYGAFEEGASAAAYSNLRQEHECCREGNE